MNRDEFETKYAQKYMGLSFVHNPPESIESIKELRDGEGYTDHHIDLCWKVQQLKNYLQSGGAFLQKHIDAIEW